MTPYIVPLEMPEAKNNPILYSFRRCPFAMRARLALHAADITVILREVALKNKPQAMLSLSLKATVPVLQLPNGDVLEESFEIMLWALYQNDPCNLLISNKRENQAALDLIHVSTEMNALIREIKFNERHPELSLKQAQENILPYLDKFEALLQNHTYLNGETLKYIDYALFPFIRQLIHIDPNWFSTLPYPETYRWYKKLHTSEAFQHIMIKHKPWCEANPLVFL